MKRLALLLLIGCTPVVPISDPPYAPSDRDGLGTVIGDACAQLRRLGCPEGFANRRGRTCFESYSRAAEYSDVPATCIKASPSVDDVRSCGGDNSIRVRCVMPAVDVVGSSAPEGMETVR